MHIAWYSEDKPFAVGYADGKLLIGSKEPLEKGAIVVIDAHKVIYFDLFLLFPEVPLRTDSLHVVFPGVHHQHEVESHGSDPADLCQRGDGEAVGQSGPSL